MNNDMAKAESVALPDALPAVDPEPQPDSSPQVIPATREEAAPRSPLAEPNMQETGDATG